MIFSAIQLYFGMVLVIWSIRMIFKVMDEKDEPKPIYLAKEISKEEMRKFLGM